MQTASSRVGFSVIVSSSSFCLSTAPRSQVQQPIRTYLPTCSVSLGGAELPVVSLFKYLGVVLTPTLRWTQHAQHLVQRGNRLFAQCVSWCRSERLPLAMASSIFMVHVLPSVSWGTEFFSHSLPALRLLDHALCRWGRFLLGWPSGSPSACWQNLVGPTLKDYRQAGCSLSHRSCMCISQWPEVSAPWNRLPHCCKSCRKLGPPRTRTVRWCSHAHMCGVVPGCLPSQVRPSLDSAFFHRVVGSASSLSVVHFPLSTLAVGVGPDSRVCLPHLPTHARLWGLARWGHDPFPGGRSARHNHLPLGCPFCLDPVGDLFHCLCVCPAFDDLRQRSGVPVQSAPEWCRHPCSSTPIRT